MSDEFNVEGRSFKDGDDPTWTALDKSDDDASAAGGGSLIFYNSSMVSTTKDGKLELKSIIDKTEWEHFDVVNQKYHHITKHFKSSMVQSWNKFCFTGGIVEVDIMLPGDPHIGGLWPAVWLLGNLGRATTKDRRIISGHGVMTHATEKSKRHKLYRHVMPRITLA